jgi:PST family polysaccharide transporter
VERALDYRSVTWAELSAQLVFFVVAVPLAFAGRGAWAPLLGWWAQHLVNFALYHRIARYRPRWHFDGAVVRRMLRYGVTYSLSLWLWHLRRLVNPFVVGRFLGAEAVAFVAVATQIVTHLSFVANATWRLATSALARIQDDARRMSNAVGEGMPLQIVAVAPFLVTFGFLAPWIVPALLGREWTDIAVVYPFVAAAWVTIAGFNLHCSALYVLARNARISLYHVVHSALLLAAALVLVPRFGLIGYGYAELASMASFAVLHVITAQVIGTLSYERMAPLWLASMLLLFHAQLGWLSIAGGVIAILWARPWRAVQGLVAGLRGSYAYE